MAILWSWSVIWPKIRAREPFNVATNRITVAETADCLSSDQKT